MTKRKIRASLAAAAVATALTAVAVPSTAHASTAAPRTSAAADGYLYAWTNLNRGGSYCRWYGDDDDWSTCSPGGYMQDQASSVENRGYAGAYGDVKLFKNIGYDASAGYSCLDNGQYLNNLANYYWSNGTGMNDSITSHYWVTGCV
ncbi:hypothetical protein [Streptomyces fuscichromogenes]|uniref:Peptidase inhibitor family I36 n=1 Tax=Streptomyces fuscichromogenes TaxID=1324013 RepID=A0A917XQD0_9ACTN|nr:hypothetical protein [Streptomyces fuscichromogenes]GGN45091.1 hypothetical protein GCM10011578_096690 [Streptomyces fuscichromogenes]